MAPFAVEDLYAPKAFTDAELVAAVAAPEGKAGKEKAQALLGAADAHLRREETERAVRAVREALALARSAGADELEALALCLLAKARTGSAFNLEALQAANKASRTFKEIGEKKGQAAALYVVAQVQESTPDPENAAWKASEARKLFRELGDQVGEGAALETMGRSYAMRQDFAKGLPAAQDAAALFKALGDGQREASSLCVAARMHLALGELDMAAQSAKDAMEKLAALKVPASEALDIITSTYMKKQEKEEAVFVAQQEADRMSGLSETKAEAHAQLKVAEAHMHFGSYDAALAPASQAASLYKGAGDRKLEAEATVTMARIKLEQRERGDAQRLAEGVLPMVRDVGEAGIDVTVEAVEVIVDCYKQANDIQKCFDTLIAAMNMFKNSGVPKGEAAMLVSISDMQVHPQVKDSEGALSTLKNAPPLYIQAGDKKGEAKALTKLAKLYSMKGQADNALKAAEEAMAIYKKSCDMVGIASAAEIIAASHAGLAARGKGNSREALRSAQEAVTGHNKAGDKASEANALLVLANAYLMTQNFNQAQVSARRAETLFQELGDQHGQASALLLVAGAKLGLGDFAEAKDLAKEARETFWDLGSTQGEDSVDDFIHTLKEYESGVLDRTAFTGFTMGAPDPADQKRKQKKEKGQKAQDLSLLSNVDLMLPGPKGEKLCVTFFDGFEARRANQAPAGRSSAIRGVAFESDEPSAKQKQEPVLFSVKYVPQPPPDADAGEKKKAIDIVDIEDRRIHLPMSLGQPNPKFPGRGPKTKRLFQAMGDPRSLA